MNASKIALGLKRAYDTPTISGSFISLCFVLFCWLFNVQCGSYGYVIVLETLRVTFETVTHLQNFEYLRPPVWSFTGGLVILSCNAKTSG